MRCSDWVRTREKSLAGDSLEKTTGSLWNWKSELNKRARLATFFFGCWESRFRFCFWSFFSAAARKMSRPVPKILLRGRSDLLRWRVLTLLIAVFRRVWSLTNVPSQSFTLLTYRSDCFGNRLVSAFNFLSAYSADDAEVTLFPLVAHS